MNKNINVVLDYMRNYVKIKYLHDSEPMLNYKDLELVLNYIDKQKEVLDKIKEIINNVISNGEVIDQLRKIEIKEILELLEEIE